MKTLQLKITTVKAPAVDPPPQPDKIRAYAQQVLELGLLFKNFEEVCNNPNRERIIRTLKLMMLLWVKLNIILANGCGTICPLSNTILNIPINLWLVILVATKTHHGCGDASG